MTRALVVLHSPRFGSYRELARVATMAEARAFLEARAALVCFEEDHDYPGHADAFDTRGDLFVVEPAKQLGYRGRNA